MRVVIYLGGFMYNSANEFSYAIGESMMKNGIDVKYVDLLSENRGELLNNAFSEKVDFVLSFNGIGCDIKIGHKSLYNELNIPFVYYLLDHPSHHKERLMVPINQKVIICLDNSHADYVEMHPEITGITTFIPTAARYEGSNYLNTEKKYDIVFTGYLKTQEELDNLFPQSMIDVKRYLDNLILHKRDIYIDQDVINMVKSIPDLNYVYETTHFDMDSLINQCDFYVRGVKRNFVMEELLKRGLTIDFYGAISNSHEFLKYPNFNNNGMVDYKDLDNVYAQAKIALNIMPNFPEGGHDRLFMSMVHGAIPLTDCNVYLEQKLPQGLIYFNYPHVEEAIQEINKVINDDDYRKTLQEINYNEVIENHTWINRLTELLYVYKESVAFWKDMEK